MVYCSDRSFDTYKCKQSAMNFLSLTKVLADLEEPTLQISQGLHKLSEELELFITVILDNED